ncbi:MAG: hypothetical protein J7M40_08730, partial [Planctomycetes bacterium]|nr:hypothetical protein [Planctomycetota bacterium]
MTGKGQTVVISILIPALLVSPALVIGWAIHYGTYKSRQTELTTANTMLQQRTDLLTGQFDALKARAEEAINELLGTNATLADTNETLATDLGRLRQTLEAITSENINLSAQLRQLHEESQKQSTQSRKIVSELTETVVALTGDLKTANARLDELMDKLQSKTKEAADLAIKVNSLVEMVARLRVMTGLTTEPAAPTDP